MPPPPLLPRLSSTTRYAAHAMIEIAEAAGQVVPAAAIVEHQRAPGHFLDQVLGKLRRAGLLHSVRGPHGGYVLARSAVSISLADIVCAIDGGPYLPLTDMPPDAASRDGAAPGCGCAVEEAWLSAGAAMHDVMRRTSLAALVLRKRALESAVRHASAASAPVR